MRTPAFRLCETREAVTRLGGQVTRPLKALTNGGARAGFTHVRLAITITGPETQERYTELRDVVDQHCPVLDLFVNATPVSATVTKG